jgi:RNA recognition motif-containing protein
MKSEISAVWIATMMMLSLRCRVSSFAFTTSSRTTRITQQTSANAVRSFTQTRLQARSLRQGTDDDGWWEDNNVTNPNKAVTAANAKPSSSAKPAASSPSWADRNQNFESRQDYATQHKKQVIQKEKDDFQSTRVWVQDIPLDANWQDLKDHFRVAGEVVYASVSTDKHTQESKGVGIVQYETPEEAQKAIKVMRDHPLVTSTTGSQGAKLYVREDFQEQRRGASININYRGKKKNKISTWSCANDDDAGDIDEGEAASIKTVLDPTKNT